MLVVFVGEAVLARAGFLGADGQPVAATGVAMKARSPGGAVSALAHEPDGATGRFRASVTATEPGTWQVYGECSGPSPSVTPAKFFRAVAKPF